MFRKMLCVLAAAGVLLLAPGARAGGTTGSLRLRLPEEGSITVTRVGDVLMDGFRLSPEYGGGLLTYDGLIDPETAAWLAQEASGGETRVSQHRTVLFESLFSGVYLVVHSGGGSGRAAAPFLTSIPWDGDQWHLETQLLLQENPSTGDAGVLPLLPGMAGSLICLGLLLLGRRKGGMKNAERGMRNAE